MIKYEDRVKRVADAIHAAYYERALKHLLPMREMAEAAIAAVYETLEITQAMVEGGAIGLFEHTQSMTNIFIDTWDTLDNDERELIRDESRAVLHGAFAVLAAMRGEDAK